MPCCRVTGHSQKLWQAYPSQDLVKCKNWLWSVLTANHPTPCWIHLAKLASRLRWLGGKGHSRKTRLALRSSVGTISALTIYMPCELPPSSDQLQGDVTCSQVT